MLNLRPFLAIPYKHKGRDFNGCDCLGFDILFYWVVLKKVLPDVDEDYSPNWQFKNKNYFLEGYYKNFDKIEKPETYDLIVFQNRQGVVNHGGVVLGYGKFVHCCKDGVLVDTYNRPEWKKRINGFYRLKT
ncbi:MAG: NlpC/P60 family protein [Candidatus Omnitrophica bacterium]|nr:NlpC/P60 family protein [Candidatus Omnitrophota bacterium]MDD5592643.1 NlpC/P60 family protein [Candidatus Omnitrophota bacterium]